MRSKGRLVTPRRYNTITPEERERRALHRAKVKLGEAEFARLKKSYGELSKTFGGHSDLLNGVIIALVQNNLSNIEIRVMTGCGVSKITRVRKLLKCPALAKPEPRVPAHACTQKDLDNIRSHLESLETEDGFPCAHRRPIKFFTTAGLSWKKIYLGYKECMILRDPPQRILSPSRWREYVRAFFPGLRLCRPKMDLCDRCVRIETELYDPNISAERKEFLEQEKKLHLEEAIRQRRT